MPLLPPGPRRVVLVDVEQPLPVLTADDRYHTAMVIGCRSGVPSAAMDVDLDIGVDRIKGRLAALVSAARREDRPPTHHVDGPPRHEAGLPRLSVVVPTVVGRVEDLALLLDGLTAAAYPGVEILLVDNRRGVPATDPLPGLMAGHPDVRVVREPQPGISAARNAGVLAATNDIVAFTDDDVRVDADWLRAIGRRFAADPALDAVTGLILPAELETPAQIWFEHYYGGFGGRRNFTAVTVHAETATGPLRRSRATVRDGAGRPLREFAIYGVGAYGAGANMAFRRSAVQRLGMFDTALGTGTPARGGEDLAMLVAVLWSGGKIGYEPSAVVHHRHRRAWPELLHQLQGNGLGFTAMLTSVILADRRHLLSLAQQVPLAVRRLTSQSVRRFIGRAPDSEVADVDAAYPRQLVISELRGYPQGPAAYLRSRRLSRRRPGAEPEAPRRVADLAATAGR